MDTRTTTRHSTSTASSGREPDRSDSCELKLRRVLRTNAATSALSGIALASAAEPLAEFIGTGHPGWVRVVGLALLPFAALCLWVASGPGDRLRSFTPAIVAADAGWVALSAVTIALGWYSGAGIVAVAAMAFAVAVFAELQWIGVRRLR